MAKYWADTQLKMLRDKYRNDNGTWEGIADWTSTPLPPVDDRRVWKYELTQGPDMLRTMVEAREVTLGKRDDLNGDIGGSGTSESDHGDASGGD